MVFCRHPGRAGAHFSQLLSYPLVVCGIEKGPYEKAIPTGCGWARVHEPGGLQPSFPITAYGAGAANMPEFKILKDQNSFERSFSGY